jgi:rSAM/selenodomain-associated transferase 2
MRDRISIVIPALDEADRIGTTLAALQEPRRAGHEVILVDGGSSDGTPDVATGLVDRVVQGARGRARQLNAGARVASGDVLLFLHADTVLPAAAIPALGAELASSGRDWGRFDVRLSGRHPMLRVVERMMNLRSRVTGIATGDQAIFVKRAAFDRVGGYPEIALMEDVALSRALKRIGRPLCLRVRATTSSRRWEEGGVVRTILLMWRLRLAYWLGADPERLAVWYGEAREGSGRPREGALP